MGLLQLLLRRGRLLLLPRMLLLQIVLMLILMLMLRLPLRLRLLVLVLVMLMLMRRRHDIASGGRQQPLLRLPLLLSERRPDTEFLQPIDLLGGHPPPIHQLAVAPITVGS